MIGIREVNKVLSDLKQDMQDVPADDESRLIAYLTAIGMEEEVIRELIAGVFLISWESMREMTDKAELDLEEANRQLKNLLLSALTEMFLVGFKLGQIKPT